MRIAQGICRTASPIIGLVLVIAAATASAQPGLSESKDMGVTANAPDVCIISNQATGRIRPLVNTTTAGNTAVEITTLIDTGTLSTAAAQADVTFDAMCNYPHKINIVSDNNGLFRPINAAPAVDGFASAVPYTADLSWGGQAIVFEANAKTRGPAQRNLLIGEPTAGQIVLKFSVLPGATNAQNGAPLAAGIYSDIIRLSVEPQ
jgi:hypothetical protein